VVSYSQVRAITRVAEAHTEAAILETARHATAAQLERILAGVHRAGAPDGRARIEARRSAELFFDEDGMLVVRARLAPEEGATLLRAMDEARRELWERPDAAERPVEQARADAFALIADKALGATARSGGERQMIVVHVDEEVLRSPDSSGESRIGDKGVPAETARRLACDSSVIEVAAAGEVGRRTRVVRAALRRALAVRDEGRCRFPGCSCRVVDARAAVHSARRAACAHRTSAGSLTAGAAAGRRGGRGAPADAGLAVGRLARGLRRGGRLPLLSGSRRAR